MSAGGSLRVFGLIPAAGASRRMGEPKQLLVWGNSTILQTVIDTVLAGGVDGLVVVTNPLVADALKLADSARHLTVVLDDPEAEMIDSISAGVETLRAVYSPRGHDAFLVCPGDLPRMSAAIVGMCLRAYRAKPGCIVVARAAGRIGHPVVVPFELADGLVELRGVGLKGLLERNRDRVREVAVADDAAMTDVDTRGDYDSLGGDAGGKS